MARSTPAIASGRAPHLACRKLRSTACPWAGGDHAAGEELRDYLPDHFPLPHPSWRSRMWEERNPWFAEDVLPALRSAIERVRAGDQERNQRDRDRRKGTACRVTKSDARASRSSVQTISLCGTSGGHWAPSDPPVVPGSPRGAPNKEADFPQGPRRARRTAPLLAASPDLASRACHSIGSCLHEQEDGPVWSRPR